MTELKVKGVDDVYVEYFNTGNHDLAKVYLKTEVDEAIAELKAKIEDAKATAYAESVDAGMRERRLKRALYKACANWADCEAGRLFWEEDMKKAEKFGKMVDKCRAMAEKFGG